MLSEQEIAVFEEQKRLAFEAFAAGNYPLAESIWATLMEDLGLPKSDPERGRLALEVLSNVLIKQDKMKEAEKCLLKAIRLNNNVLDHQLLSASCLNKLAVLYLDTNRYRQAEDIFKGLLKSYEKIDGSDKMSVATVCAHLARLYQSTDVFDKAETMYARALKIKTELLGVKHPDVVALTQDYSVLLELQGRDEDAKRLHLEAKKSILPKVRKFTVS